jgi:CHAD domain-containing protein
LADSNFIVPPHDATGSAARSAIAFHFRALTAQVPAAMSGDAEPVHQVRVATRRLRAAIRLFAPYISAIKPKDIDERLKWIGAQAGAVRDLDVLAKTTQKRARKLDPLIAKDLDPLFEEIRASRKKAADSLAAALTSRRYKSLVTRLSEPIALTPEGDAAFGAVAGELFAPMLKSTLRAGGKMHEDPTPEDLHFLRKRAKRARYALETMLAISEKQLREVIEHLETLQELLGRYHDAVVAVKWIKDFANSRELPLNVAFGCGALAESLQRRERRLKLRGLKEWRRFTKTGPERRIEKALDGTHPKASSTNFKVVGLTKGVSQKAANQKGASNDDLHNAPRTRRGSHSEVR